MIYSWIIPLCCIGAVSLLTAAMGLLSRMGALSGALIASIIYAGGGLTGIALLAGFFILGAGATLWKSNTKRRQGLSEGKVPGGRSGYQVWANGGVAAAAGLLSFLYPVYTEFFLLLMAASLASATADTLSSELGVVYGRKFYNITSFRPDRRGENGAVSLEGTLIGMAGAAVLGIIYGIGVGHQQYFITILVAGAIGNIADSIFGATLERRQLIGNDLVNLLNTATGAIVGALMYYFVIR